MTYIDYLNAFNQWLETNALPVSSQLLYFKMLNVFNRAGWPEDVGVDNLRLMFMAGLKSEKSAIQARDKLVETGFIIYQKGKKGSPNRYFLVNTGVNTGVNTVKKDSHIKTKTKTKEISPDGDTKKDPAVAAVMSAYMDRINPNVSEQLVAEMLGFLQAMGQECCLRAIQIAQDERKTQWSYVRGILRSKQAQGVRCLADWDAIEAKHENKKRGGDDGYEYL